MKKKRGYDTKYEQNITVTMSPWDFDVTKQSSLI